MTYTTPLLYYYFTVLLLFSVTSTVNSCPPSDRAALLSIKSSLHEQQFGIFKSWTGNDCCHDWYGVSCDQETKRVADINLRGELLAGKSGHMTGTISPSICDLERLSSLTIADWKGISGQIPACITNLPFLRIIELIGNNLTGTIPRDIGRLKRLTVLNFGDNRLHGQIPGSIVNLTSLMHLDLRGNMISGNVPRYFGRLQMLSRALLSRNLLSGPVPSSFSSIYRLADLDLSLNKLSGGIPSSFGKMAVLATLNLDGNNISGTIPASLLTSSIINLNLSGNSIEGTIPDVFGPRSYFTALDLSHNKLKGRIPSSILQASYIGHLDLSYNHLCGRIPSGSPFDHLEASSFVNNACLCGKPLKSC